MKLNQETTSMYPWSLIENGNWIMMRLASAMVEKGITEQIDLIKIRFKKDPATGEAMYCTIIVRVHTHEDDEHGTERKIDEKYSISDMQAEPDRLRVVAELTEKVRQQLAHIGECSKIVYAVMNKKVGDMRTRAPWIEQKRDFDPHIDG